MENKEQSEYIHTINVSDAQYKMLEKLASLTDVSIEEMLANLLNFALEELIELIVITLKENVEEEVEKDAESNSSEEE